MQEKSVLLTPNKNLSKHLQKQFCKTFSLQNKRAWPSTEILPLTVWLLNCWQKCLDPRILLSPFQEKFIWQNIITENLGENFKNLAEFAIYFHRLVNEWQININFSASATEDITIFHSLYKNFTNYCKNKNFVTTSELPTIINPYITRFNFSKITFAGFDEYNPQLQSLIASIEKTGCKVLKIDPTQQNSTQKYLGFDTLNQEITVSAEWVKHIINNNHESNIGIVVPNLTKLRTKITQIFTQVLGDIKNVNISAGIPLKTLPIINCAMELLSLVEPFDLKSINNILLSPYINGSKTEKSERILFNFQLQQLEYSHFSLNDIKQLAKKHGKNTTLIIETLQKWRDLLSSIQNKILHNSEWVQIFAEILQTLGWPGENNLTDLESIAIKYFTKSLQEISATNLIINKVPYKKALQTLQELVSYTTLQTEPEADASIHIIGTLEAIGINFDYLWIMGLDEENWPTTPKPNPFIPIALQKKLSLPHAFAERELHFCKTLIQRYKRSAKEVIFSYVKQIEDRIIAPSSLIVDIPESSINDLNLTKNIFWPEKIYRCKKLEAAISNQAPKLAVSEIIRAPSRLIELQSLCPFRAFIEFRLKTKESKKPGLGISKIDRGILTHEALEYFWQNVKTKQNLCALDSVELQKLIYSSVEKSLNKLILSKFLYKLEKKCLVLLLTKLIEIEKERPSFKVVATEKSAEINLASIPIKLRVDRIDQIDNGKILLIDYKTGKILPSVFNWFGPRPQNIQLLLYSLAIDAVEGLAFIQVNTESTKFKNISLEELAIGLRTMDPDNKLKNGITWPELITYWRNILTKIAGDFVSGKASITPSSPQVCKQCDFSSACRIIH